MCVFKVRRAINAGQEQMQAQDYLGDLYMMRLVQTEHDRLVVL
jgi:hypothetical protein